MSQEHDLQGQLRAATEEIHRLKELLTRNGIPLPAANGLIDVRPLYLPNLSDVAATAAPASKEERIALFRSIFRGREDVYAERWRMKNGRRGYRPACQKNWEAVLASKPKDRTKVDRETRKLFPLTEDVIRLHLTGKMIIGIYPLLADETCWLLAADFDNKTWQEDALAFVATCHKVGVPAYLERSRSGNGGHVWIFFERALSAVLARKMGCAILTQTMERRHHLGLD